LKSPVRKQQKHSLSPNTAESLYTAAEYEYEQQKKNLIRLLQQNDQERQEHIDNRDQREKSNNFGKYNYIHNE